jgi:hypothetical protein
MKETMDNIVSQPVDKRQFEKELSFLIYKSKTKCDRINMQTKKLFFSKKTVLSAF